MGISDLMGLSGKVAVVTGASRGIGRACALYLAQAGAKVVVNYKENREAAEETLRAIEAQGGQGMVFPCDVSQVGEAAALIGAAAGRPRSGPRAKARSARWLIYWALAGAFRPPVIGAAATSSSRSSYRGAMCCQS